MFSDEVRREVILAARGVMNDYSIPLDAALAVAADHLGLATQEAVWVPDRRQLVMILRQLPAEVLEALRPMLNKSLDLAEVRDTVSIELNGKPV